MVDVRSYFQIVAPTYLENWPNTLAALSIRQVGVTLAIGEVNALGRLNGVHAHRFAPQDNKALASLKAKLGTLFERFSGGRFVRLGSRSPKDTALGLLTGCYCSNAEAAFRLLTNGSQRLAFDLDMALRAGYAPYVFAREWHAIEPWMELRCFMRERCLVGISQYHFEYREAGATLHDRADEVLASMSRFFPSFQDVCHLETVVFDVALRVNDNALDTILIEINPWIPQTQPCLFSWASGGDFDGTLRYVRAKGATKETVHIHRAR